ncbi:hypothetical protein CPC08DRAFT_717280, partial [Agrocybe pediades]
AVFDGGVVWKLSKGLSKPELANIDCRRRVYSRLVAYAMCQAIEEWVIMSKPDNDKHVRVASRRHDPGLRRTYTLEGEYNISCTPRACESFPAVSGLFVIV